MNTTLAADEPPDFGAANFRSMAWLDGGMVAAFPCPSDVCLQKSIPGHHKLA